MSSRESTVPVGLLGLVTSTARVRVERRASKASSEGRGYPSSGEVGTGTRRTDPAPAKRL